MAAKHLVNLMQTIAVEGINQTTLVTVTATGNSREFYEFAGADAVAIYVDCTGVTGSGTVQFALQERDPATGVFFTASDAPAFTLISGAVAGVRYVLNPCLGECYQLAWTVTGTSVTVSAVAQLISWGK